MSYNRSYDGCVRQRKQYGKTKREASSGQHYESKGASRKQYDPKEASHGPHNSQNEYDGQLQYSCPNESMRHIQSRHCNNWRDRASTFKDNVTCEIIEEMINGAMTSDHVIKVGRDNLGRDVFIAKLDRPVGYGMRNKHGWKPLTRYLRFVILGHQIITAYPQSVNKLYKM
jgi:hypothetical protein